MLGTLRAALFQASFYVWTFVLCLFGLPFMLTSRRRAWVVGRLWGKVSLFLLRTITGTRLEPRGLHNIPKGACLVASKHQSALETLALYSFFEDPTYILKKELMYVPLFGWWMLKFAQIPIARKKGRSALEQMVARGREAVAEDRQILIFPEGTRKSPGEAPNYKFGVTRLYRELGVPCVPVAINAGVFWPRRRVSLTPGVTVMEFLPPIPSGLTEAEFSARLQTAIETASDALLVEAAEAGVPLPPLAQDRVRVLATQT